MASPYGGSAPVPPASNAGAIHGSRMKERIAQLLRGTQPGRLKIARHPRSLSTGRVVPALGDAGAKSPRMQEIPRSPRA